MVPETSAADGNREPGGARAGGRDAELLSQARRGNELLERQNAIMEEQTELLRAIHRESKSLAKGMEGLAGDALRSRRILDTLRTNAMRPTLASVADHVGSRQLGLLETIEAVASDGMSFARFGDGEFKMIHRLDFSAKFQRNSPELQSALVDVLGNPAPGLLVGMPHLFSDLHWTQAYAETWDAIRPLLPADGRFGDSHVSRPIVFQAFGVRAAEAWSRVWSGQRALVITGVGSRFELLPALFGSLASHEVLLSRATNAFDDLPRVAAEAVSADFDIALISLGPAGTVLAAQLAAAGRRAIDLGHLSSSYNHALAGGDFPEHSPLSRTPAGGIG